MPAPPEAVLTVVGSGTLLPDAAHGSAGFHLDVPGADGERRGLLLDCGSGTLHGLARQRIDWRAIDVIAVSHYHTDHVGDLAAILGALRHVGRTHPLTILGPEDFRAYLHRLASVAGAWVTDPGFPIRVVPLGAPPAGPEDFDRTRASGTWRAPDGMLAVDSCATPHTDVSRALRITGPWGRIGYTGDTGPSDDVADFLDGCDVLVAECALPDPPGMDTHLSPLGLAAMARRARPGLLVSTHVYPPRTGETAAGEVSAAWGGRVVAGRDGMRVRIAPGGATVDRTADGP